MKTRLLTILLLSVLSLTTFAQGGGIPNWYDLDMQRASYPDASYYKGMAEDSRRSGESLEAATKRIKDDARAEAASTVRTRVQSTTTNNALSQTIRTMEGTFRQSTRELSKSTTTTTDMELPGLQVESWQNPQTGTIAAFAYVKKSSLIRQLEKKITVGLTKIEASIEQVDEMVAGGQKMKARELAEKSLPLFDEVKESQLLLAAVDEDADAESLQLNQTSSLQKRLSVQVAQLKNGINIYLSCKADLLDQTYSTMASEIKGELSKMGCTFVTKPEDADWAIYVTAKAREYNAAKYGEYTTYFTYTGAFVAMDKVVTGQRIYENAIPEEKGAHTQSFVEAARDGYKLLIPKVISIIKENIQQ